MKLWVTPGWFLIGRGWSLQNTFNRSPQATRGTRKNITSLLTVWVRRQSDNLNYRSQHSRSSWMIWKTRLSHFKSLCHDTRLLTLCISCRCGMNWEKRVIRRTSVSSRSFSQIDNLMQRIFLRFPTHKNLIWVSRTSNLEGAQLLVWMWAIELREQLIWDLSNHPDMTTAVSQHLYPVTLRISHFCSINRFRREELSLLKI